MTASSHHIGDLLNRAPVIPVIVIDDEAVAVPLARALVAGGLTVLEVTLRTKSPSRRSNASWPRCPTRSSAPAPY